MQLPIQVSYNEKVFTPYQYGEREYFLLFRRNGLEGPFLVSDSPFDTSGTLIQVGVMTNDAGTEAGYIFYSKSPTICEGTFLMAYSGVFRAIVNSPRARIIDNGVEPVLKTSDFYLYNRKNSVTLVVQANVKAVIKRNFEI